MKQMGFLVGYKHMALASARNAKLAVLVKKALQMSQHVLSL
jgi:hypothetical protein